MYCSTCGRTRSWSLFTVTRSTKTCSCCLKRQRDKQRLKRSYVDKRDKRTASLAEFQKCSSCKCSKCANEFYTGFRTCKKCLYARQVKRAVKAVFKYLWNPQHAFHNNDWFFPANKLGRMRYESSLIRAAFTNRVQIYFRESRKMTTVIHAWKWETR